MKQVKFFVQRLLNVGDQLSLMMKIGKYFNDHIPYAGIVFSIIIDRLILLFFALDCSSRNIFVADLRIPHPAGVLLGGNGIQSRGKVLVNAGVKFVGKSPKNQDYLVRHSNKNVFALGDGIVIGANAVLIGPLTICDNVIIGAGAVVTKDVIVSGTYVGVPAKRVSDANSEEWFI